MVARITQCNQKALQQLLDADADPQLDNQIVQHIETCSHCRTQMESMAADESMWSGVQYLLETRDEPPQTVHFHGTKKPSTNSNPTIRPKSFSTPLDRKANGDQKHEARPDVQDGGDFAEDDIGINDVAVLSVLAPSSREGSLGRLDDYEIEGVIGRGGMGVVLRAHDRCLERQVAIKVLAPHLASSGAARQRFQREARAAAAVMHEHVVAIHGVCDTKGLPYIVMPLISGPSLQSYVDEQGPLEISHALRIAMQVAMGLSAAHRQGLVHRDVKPANVLMDDNVDRVKLTDFGLARAADDASLTRTGVIAGTPHYMSPEQAAGGMVDARSDLYGLGSLLFFMLSGRPPFRAETTLAVLERIRRDRPKSIRAINPDVPKWLEQLIDRLHEKKPSNRFENAEQVTELIGKCLTHLQAPDRRARPAISTSGSRTRQRIRWSIAMLALFAVTMATGLIIQSRGENQDRRSSNDGNVGDEFHAPPLGEAYNANDAGATPARLQAINELDRELELLGTSIYEFESSMLEADPQTGNLLYTDQFWSQEALQSLWILEALENDIESVR